MTLANMKRRNEFRVRVDCDIHPRIANLRGIALADAAVVLLDACPDFVKLQVLTMKVPHPGIHQGLTAFPGENEHAHDRVPV
jgi:hypothetical protein